MKVIKPLGDYMPNTPYGFETQVKNYQKFARSDALACIISIFPILLLWSFYRKNEEAWKRDKALLSPAFIVLGACAVLGLYTEVHLSTISWMDIMLTESACNWTFNSLLTLAMTPYLFMPAIILLQLIDCFFKLNLKWIKLIAYSWAAITGGVRFIQTFFGESKTSVMCHGCRVIMPLFDIEFFNTQRGRDLSALLGCSVIVLGGIGAVLKRFNVPVQFMEVDLHTIKRTFALTFPTVVLIIATKIITSDEYYYVPPIVELNLRVVFSSCHLGSISMLLLLVNHPRELWTFISKSLLCQRREKTETTTKIEL